MAIVFGSPEAAAILERDRERLRQEALEAEEKSPEYIKERIEEIEAEIEALQEEMCGLEEERDELRAKLKEATP